MSYPSYQPENQQAPTPLLPPGYPPVTSQPPPTQQIPTQQLPEYPAQPPVSGPGAPGFPTGAMQTSGASYGTAPPGRGSTTSVLAAVAGLFFVLAAVLGGLYFDKRGELRDTKADLATRTSEMQTQQRLVAEQSAKTAEAEKHAADLTGELDKTKASLTDMTSDRKVLMPCMQRIQEMFQAAREGNGSATIRALERARTACDKAEINVDR